MQRERRVSERKSCVSERDGRASERSSCDVVEDGVQALSAAHWRSTLGVAERRREYRHQRAGQR
jgi:hypothetical protein